MPVLEGSLDGEGLRVCIVVSRWNEFVTRKLLEGADVTLNPGDSIMFASRVPHSWLNPMDEPAKVLVTLAVAEDRRRPQVTNLF